MYNVIVTISLLNFVFMMFFFVFLTNANKAKKYWIILLLYMQFLLVIRFLYSLRIFPFTIDKEMSALIGLYFGTGDPRKEQGAMISYWIVLLIISVQYRLFHTKLAKQFQDVQLKFRSFILEKIRLFVVEL